MFNYNKELIVNNLGNVLVDGETLVIKRGANYKKENIYCGKVYKTKGNEGECAVATIDTQKLLGTSDYHQFLIFVKTPSKELSDYGLANWHEFGKPIIIETACHDLKDIVAAFNLALPTDNPFYKAEEDGTKVKITLAEPWMAFDEIRVFAHKPVAWDPDNMAELKEPNMVEITSNVEEFATAKWIVENLRFPTTANLRYNRLYADESPVAGTVYTQYAFEYMVERSAPGGVSTIGQKVDSITGHVIYVPSSEEDNFEALLSQAWGLGTFSAVTDEEDHNGHENEYVATIA